MGERTIFVDEFQDTASKDGDWLIIGKFTESVYCSLGISLIVPVLSKYVFFTINFISPISSYAQITNQLFFFNTLRDDHFLSGKHLK
jgi:hypothetical protein